MTDTEWISLNRADPQEGLRALLLRHHAVAAALARRILPKRPQDAEEVLQDAFLYIWQNAERFNPSRGTLQAFVICAVRSRALNRLRMLRRNVANSLDALSLSDDFDLEDAFFRRESADMVQAAVAQQTEPDKTILLRRYWLLESVKEIARHMGLTEKQVESRLYRAKIRLRELLQEEAMA